MLLGKFQRRAPDVVVLLQDTGKARRLQLVKQGRGARQFVAADQAARCEQLQAVFFRDGRPGRGLQVDLRGTLVVAGVLQCLRLRLQAVGAGFDKRGHAAAAGQQCGQQAGTQPDSPVKRENSHVKSGAWMCGRLY